MYQVSGIWNAIQCTWYWCTRYEYDFNQEYFSCFDPSNCDEQNTKQIDHVETVKDFFLGSCLVDVEYELRNG